MQRPHTQDRDLKMYFGMQDGGCEQCPGECYQSPYTEEGEEYGGDSCLEPQRRRSSP